MRRGIHHCSNSWMTKMNLITLISLFACFWNFDPHTYFNMSTPIPKFQLNLYKLNVKIKIPSCCFFFFRITLFILEFYTHLKIHKKLEYQQYKSSLIQYFFLKIWVGFLSISRLLKKNYIILTIIKKLKNSVQFFFCAVQLCAYIC